MRPAPRPMRRTLSLALLLVCLIAPSTSAAQGRGPTGSFGVLVGATLPSGDLNDELETGFNLGVTLSLESPAFPLALRTDATWHRMALSAFAEDESEHLRIVAGTANLQYTLALPFRPYLIGGAGVYNIRDPRLDGDENELGWNLGLGMRIPVAPVEVLAELRFHRLSREGESMTLVPITLGALF